MRKELLSLLFYICIAFFAAGCANDNDNDNNNNDDNLLQTFVAIGDSITEGDMSLDANEFTQEQTFPALIAQQANTAFNIPFMVQENAGFTRVDATVEPNNLGVSGLSVALNNQIGNTLVESIDPNAFPKELDAILAPSTVGNNVIDEAINRNPTFVTLLLGNNDALGSVAFTTTNLGFDLIEEANITYDQTGFPLAASLDLDDPRGLGFSPIDRMSDPTDFQRLFNDEVIDPLLTQTTAKIAVANIINVTDLGHLMTLDEAKRFFIRYAQVNGVAVVDQATIDAVWANAGFGGNADALVPLDIVLLGLQIFFQVFAATQDVTQSLATISTTTPIGTDIAGTPNAALFDWDVNNLDTTEDPVIENRIAALNTIISNLTINSANGDRFALVDANATFADIAVNGKTIDDADGNPVPGLPLLSRSYAGTAGAGFNAGIFSLDGFHPGFTGQAIIANEFIQAINRSSDDPLGGFDEDIPLVDVSQIVNIDPFFDKDEDAFITGFDFTADVAPFNAILRDADDDDNSNFPGGRK